MGTVPGDISGHCPPSRWAVAVPRGPCSEACDLGAGGTMRGAGRGPPAAPGPPVPCCMTHEPLGPPTPRTGEEPTPCPSHLLGEGRLECPRKPGAAGGCSASLCPSQGQGHATSSRTSGTAEGPSCTRPGCHSPVSAGASSVTPGGAQPADGHYPPICWGGSQGEASAVGAGGHEQAVGPGLPLTPRCCCSCSRFRCRTCCWLAMTRRMPLTKLLWSWGMRPMKIFFSEEYRSMSTRTSQEAL